MKNKHDKVEYGILNKMKKYSCLKILHGKIDEYSLSINQKKKKKLQNTCQKTVL